MRSSRRENDKYICYNDLEAYAFYKFSSYTHQQAFNPGPGDKKLTEPGLQIPYEAIAELKRLKDEKLAPNLKYFRIYYKMTCGTIVYTIIDLDLCTDDGRLAGYKTVAVGTQNGVGDRLRLEYWCVLGNIEELVDLEKLINASNS